MLSTIRKSKIYGTIFVVSLAAAALVAVGCEQQTTQEPATVPATVDVTEPEPVVPTTPAPTPEPAPVEPAPSVPTAPPMPPEVPDPEPEEPPMDDIVVTVDSDGTTEKEPIVFEIINLTAVKRVLYSDEEYGIELRYPEYLDIGDNPQTFGLDLKGTVFIDAEGAQASVSIAYDNLSDRIEKLADRFGIGGLGGLGSLVSSIAGDLQTYTDVITQYLEQELELSLEITPEVDLMLGGLNAAQVTYTKDNLKVTHIWTVKDDRVYILTYAAAMATYDESLYLFNNIVDSFKFR